MLDAFTPESLLIILTTVTSTPIIDWFTSLSFGLIIEVLKDNWLSECITSQS